MRYSVAENEKERLERLRGLEIFDAPSDPDIDVICRDVARRFAVPIALVSLVDADRQWFLSRVGLEAEQTCRDVAFCNYTILADDVFVVSDAAADQRFAHNPLVLGDPFIRFYAGAPLFMGERIRLGSLCLIDTRPRAFGPDDRAALAREAERVSGHIWAHGAATDFDAFVLDVEDWEAVR
ncbi:GAF domain-containing protein [Salinarimonas ramus]|uniref:GAF domain-containing protein n=1 Tax=Salinarimonas ramus TaxID=690164 RepID=A0A917Q615_9HYPH|nr:GAF domain-containing protein [Salinarimonas ramus]GGK28411.1 hypothetical protein GCM10011322_13590 [Salinarimonas ramus]